MRVTNGHQRLRGDSGQVGHSSRLTWVGPKGIRVNGQPPGFVQTEGAAGLADCISRGTGIGRDAAHDVIRADGLRR
jgi:hypothetical protein